MKRLLIFLFLLMIVGTVSAVEVVIWPETDGYLGMNTDNTYSSHQGAVEADTLNADSDIIAIRLEAASADGYYDRFYRSVPFIQYVNHPRYCNGHGSSFAGKRQRTGYRFRHSGNWYNWRSIGGQQNYRHGRF